MTTRELVRVSAETSENGKTLRTLDAKYRRYLTQKGNVDETLKLLDEMYNLAFRNLRLYKEGQRNEFKGEGIILSRESVAECVRYYTETLERLSQSSISLRMDRMLQGRKQ